MQGFSDVCFGKIRSEAALCDPPRANQQSAFNENGESSEVAVPGSDYENSHDYEDLYDQYDQCNDGGRKQ